MARHKRKTWWTVLAVALMVAVSGPAMAWGRQGHATVAAIARAHLDSQAMAAVKRLLSIQPGATMVSVASWADEHRTKTTAKWHFTNFPKGDCHYKPPVECKHGECLVNAVDTEAAILGNRAESIQARETALKYIIHLAGGDSSQPLHNWGPGAGGNAYHVVFKGRHTNLHHVWDTLLIKDMATPKKGIRHFLSHGRPNYKAFRRRLVKASMQIRASSSTNPVAWVEHSCKIANEPGFFPKSHKITRAYMAQWEPVVERQLIRGGMHLAAILNLELGGGDTGA